MIRIIGHLDMDAFFAAVEERNNPHFAGLPIAVGGDPRGGEGRGVLSTANYKARAYGLHSAQSVKQAWRLAKMAEAQGKPPVVFLSGGFGTYGPVSKKIMAILSRYTNTIQKRSIDEAYFDLSHAGSFEAAEKMCREIKEVIKKEEELTASIGIAPNKLVAKIASDHDKPNGLTLVRPAAIQSFLAHLPLRDIPGIGPKTEQRLRRHSIHTVADLQRRSYEELDQLLGKWGQALYHKARGEDDAPLTEARIAKSMGKHRTFGRDIADSHTIVTEVFQMADGLLERLFNEGFSQFRTVVITVRFYDFQTQTRSKTLPKSINSADQLKLVALQLLLPFFDSRENPSHKKIRLVGLRLEKLH